MALVPHVSAPTEERNDITHNLPSLQFESALTNEEKEFLCLRARSHAITVSQCAHAAYFVSVCNKTRQLTAAKRTAEKKASKRIQEGVPRYDMKIGILGCGRLGSHLAVSLLTYGMVDPSDLEISTRRPETLDYLQGKGVTCYYDNKRLAETSDLLFFCVLPSQLPPVLDELKLTAIKPTCLLYSFVLSVTPQKLKYLLNFSNIIKPEVSWDPNNTDKDWDYTSHINSVLEKPEIVEKTSPLSFNKDDCVVTTSEKFAEMMIFAMVNMLSALGIPKWNVIDTVNTVVFGEQDNLNTFVEENFVKRPNKNVQWLEGASCCPGAFKAKEEQEVYVLCWECPVLLSVVSWVDSFTPLRWYTIIYFPNFDLTRLTNGHTPVLRKLVSDKSNRQAYQTVYCQIFKDYVHAQKYAPVQKAF